MGNPKNASLKVMITREICDFVENHMKKPGIATKWGKPLVGFADAADPYILKLKEIVGSSHAMPEDVLDDASIIVAYYLPFTKELAKSNVAAGRMASAEWALAYEETNSLLVLVSEHVIEYLGSLGYRAAVSERTGTFDRDKLMSDWSHRHFAYAAGLGTFGINNMLITKSGCCGRFFSLVTNIDVTPDTAMKEELCLYKKNGKCLVCVKNCPMGALGTGGYDRHKCYSLCVENSKIHTGFGNSYGNPADGDSAIKVGSSPSTADSSAPTACTGSSATGSEVCGKCITDSPCAFKGYQPLP